jgi:hypothetical protein
MISLLQLVVTLPQPYVELTLETTVSPQQQSFFHEFCMSKFNPALVMPGLTKPQNETQIVLATNMFSIPSC